uniref:serine C-palmitoyltransferase n=1 Tax=Plectus sambesii TaxID=2011161 RepID=A0A914X6B7_9BILA
MTWGDKGMQNGDTVIANGYSTSATCTICRLPNSRKSPLDELAERESKNGLRVNVDVIKEEAELKSSAVSQSPEDNEFPDSPYGITVFTIFNWLVLLLFAYFREFLRRVGMEENKSAVEHPKQRDFARLYSSFDSLFARNMYMRVRDVFERAIGSTPGARVNVLDRTTADYGWNFQYTGEKTEIINVSSYNYLGFAQSEGPCADSAVSAISAHGLSTCSTVQEQGPSQEQVNLERLTARFLGVEDAMCFSMGFATNAMNTACLVDKDSLIISDELNHASLILGSRLSGAEIKVFKHNDMADLERVLQQAITSGVTKSRRPLKKILIIVEGIYSMEGSICNLPAIIALKKKYRAYLYLDEAHSIGALGPTGRGVVDYWGCNPKDIDILMGTFTKSFGAAGGYIAGLKKTIDHLRRTSSASTYASPMSPPVAQQVYSSMSIIMGADGSDEGQERIRRLARNTRYFRRRLKQMGFIVYGSNDSPVVPVLLYAPTICGFWGREMFKRSVGVVVVSFPATALTRSRVRFCISAAHDKDMLDQVLQAVSEVGDLSSTKFAKSAKNLIDVVEY